MSQAVRFSARLSHDSRRPARSSRARRFGPARLWLDFALIASVVVLGLWVYYGAGGPASGKDRLTALHPDEVQSIVVTRAGSNPIELARGESGWTLKHGGGNVPAGELRMRTLLDLISAPVLSHYPAKSLKLSDADLDPPKLKLNVDGTLIQLGGVNALTQRRYVLIGDEIKLIEDNYFDLFADGPAQYVSSRLIPDGWKLRKLTIPALVIEADERGDWHAVGETKPEPQDKAADVARSWQQASAIAVSESGDDEALQEVSLGFDGGHELRFLVIATDPELVLARPDVKIAYHFGPQQAGQLMATAAAGQTPLTPSPGPAEQAAVSSPAAAAPATPPLAPPSAGNTAAPAPLVLAPGPAAKAQENAASPRRKSEPSQSGDRNKKSSAQIPKNKAKRSTEGAGAEASVKSTGSSAALPAPAAGPHATTNSNSHEREKSSAQTSARKAKRVPQGSSVGAAAKSVGGAGHAPAQADTRLKASAQKPIKKSLPPPAPNEIDD